jgi:protein ImuA
MLVNRADIIAELQTDIIRLEGFKTFKSQDVDVGLGPIKYAFPNGSFPKGAVHEFLTSRPEDAAATCGFISGLLSTLMGKNGSALWISSSRSIFPPALKNFGVQPDRFIFIDVQTEKDVLWATNEALKCGALTAVVAEIRDVSFTESRRLQLSVEESQVTGLVFRRNTQKIDTTAFVSRWKISSVASEQVDDLPGIGFPKWNVELLRIRNGKPGCWELQWKNNRFVSAEPFQSTIQYPESELVSMKADEHHYPQKQAG